MVDFDFIDLRILDALQRDASQSIEQIAQAVGLSQNPCWRRIKRLESEGVIARRVAIVDPAKLGVGVTVFVSVRTNQHNDEWLEGFTRGVNDIPEIVEFYRMSGEVDYLLKILVRDIAEYDRVYKRLIRVAELYDVSSSFSMEQLKHSTAIPLPSEEELASRKRQRS